MAWVNINGHRYYRRSRRVGGRVCTEHIGGGWLGRVAAELDACDRQIRRLKRFGERMSPWNKDLTPSPPTGGGQNVRRVATETVPGAARESWQNSTKGNAPRTPPDGRGSFLRVFRPDPTGNSRAPRQTLFCHPLGGFSRDRRPP